MSGITQDSQVDVEGDAVQIEGGTDQTRIGNVDDRLKVEATLGSMPSDKAVHFAKDFENGGSNDMTVDGSSVNVEFSAGPGAGEIWYVRSLIIKIDDAGSTGQDDFGAISGGLTNGVLVETEINSTDYELKILKSNLDIVGSFQDSNFRGQANAFIHDVNFYTGKLHFEDHVTTLTGDDGDKMKVTIRDNVTGLNVLIMAMEAYKVVT